MAVKRQLSKQKGIEMCADLLFIGKKRNDILQELAKTFKISSSTVDKWLKLARPIVETKQKEAEEDRKKEIDALSFEALKSGLKSDLELEVFLCQIAVGDIQVEEFIKGISVLRNTSPGERIKAIDLIYKKRGSYAATKTEITGKNGEPLYKDKSKEELADMLQSVLKKLED